MFVCVCALVCVCVSFIKRVCCGNFWYCRIERIITLCDVVVLSHHGLERKLVVLYVCLCVCSVCVCVSVCMSSKEFEVYVFCCCCIQYSDDMYGLKDVWYKKIHCLPSLAYNDCWLPLHIGTLQLHLCLVDIIHCYS